KLLNGQAFENAFDVFGINVLPFFGDDHVFLAAKKLQMAPFIEAAQVACVQPAVDDGLGSEFGIVEVTSHDRLAANTDLADALRVGTDTFQFHTGQRLTDSVRTKGLEIVDGDRSARFRKAVAICYGDA